MIRLVLSDDVKPFFEDPKFENKFWERVYKSGGWGFTVRHNGVRVRVTALLGGRRRLYRRVYVEEV